MMNMRVLSGPGSKPTSSSKYYGSLVLIILFVACFLILISNWWNLSTQNVELLRQTNVLQEELKISIEERDSCNKMYTSVQDRIKKLEDQLAFMHVQMKKEFIETTSTTND